MGGGGEVCTGQATPSLSKLRRSLALGLSPQRVGPPEVVSGCPQRVSQRWHRLSPSSRPQSHLCVTPPPASPSPANQSPSPPDSASRAVSAFKLHFYLRRRPVPGSFHRAQTSCDTHSTASWRLGHDESRLALPSGSTQSPGEGHTHKQSPASVCLPLGSISQFVK